MEMNRIICKSCEKLIGLMLKQQAGRGVGMHSRETSHRIWLNLVVVTKDKHTGATSIHLLLQA